MNSPALPRFLTSSVERAADVQPVVVVTGARQTGKSTLVRELLTRERTYYSLDDLDVRAQAERSPDDLVRRSLPMVLDEVQRAPDVLLAVKRAVDEVRQPGRYILTGSANLLLMRGVSESLAGRATYLTLWPLTRRERLGLGSAGPWGELLATEVEQWPDLLSSEDSEPANWRVEARVGGYPVPALQLDSQEARAIWHDGYVQTYLERDLRELSAIDSLVDFRALMRAVNFRVGNLVNQTELGRDVQLPQPTVRRWLNLLETSFLLVRLPAYSVNRTKRLIKTPKAYWCDTALSLHIGGGLEPSGAHLENLILSDLLVWRDRALGSRPGLHYWRTAQGDEVDFVVESDQKLLGIEVKAGKKARTSDAKHLFTFRDEYGEHVRGCLLLYDGDTIEWLGPRVLAVPWWRLV